MPRPISPLFALQLVLITAVLSSPAWAQSTVAVEPSFASLGLPDGVATDLAGHVFVSGRDLFQGATVSRLAADGSILWTRVVPNSIGSRRARLATHPVSGRILVLLDTGQLSGIDPDTGQQAVLLNLRSMSIDLRHAWDVHTNQLVSFIDIGASSLVYGDLAIRRRTDGVELFMTAETCDTTGGILSTCLDPRSYVIRVREITGQAPSARLIVASTIQKFGQTLLFRGSRGIAASAAFVMTTLPVDLIGGLAVDEAVVLFPADFEPAPGFDLAKKPVVGATIFSHGMTTDSAGRIYLATDFSPCQDAAALLILSDEGTCVSLGVTNAQTADVAITPDGRFAYMTYTVPPQFGVINPVAITALARFTLPVEHALSVSIVGSGTVKSNPQGIDCPGVSCSATFGDGTSVALSATPATGWKFVSWGGACAGTGACAVAMSAARSVSATFGRIVATPSVTVTLPNGGEKLYTNTPVTIRWTSNADAAARFEVLVSANAGVSFSPIAGCADLSGSARSCVWAPEPVTGTARVKVTVRDAAGNSISDQSNSDFSINLGTATVAVTSPNTAVNWGVGSTQVIKWSHNVGSGSFMTIETSRDGGITWSTVTPSVKNSSSSSGSFNWRVTGPLTLLARIRVKWTGNAVVADVSNVNFTIADPFIKLAGPSSTATSWGYGTTQRQTWTTNLGPIDKLAVKLSLDGGVTFATVLAASVTATAKRASFTVPTLGEAVSTARTRVEWIANMAVRGTNPTNFRIERPFVRVTKPNVSTLVWTAGTSASITWAHNLGTLEKVRVELSRDGGTSYPLVLLSSTTSDGSQSVLVQSTWASSAAHIRLSWLKNLAINDASDQSFAIR